MSSKQFNNSNEVFLKVGREVPEQDVNLIFYSTPEITPENNIKIINSNLNMSTNINSTSDMVCYVDEGYKLFYNVEKDSSEFKYNFYSKNFVLSDKKNNGTAMFYKHELRYVHLDTDYEEVFKNIKIIDSYRNEIPEEYFYYLEVEELPGKTNNKKRFKVVIYLNFKIQGDEQYKIIYMPENKNLKNYEEILNAQDIYHRVSTSDFYQNRLNTDDKVYAIEKMTDGFAILVPIKAVMQLLNEEDEIRNRSYLSENDFVYDTKEFFISFNDANNKIYADINPMLEEFDYWYVDINYDSFVDNSMDRKFVYDIPEFFYQDIVWLNGYPCMINQGEEPDIEDERTINLKNKPLYIETKEDGDGLIIPSNIEVRDSAGKIYKVVNWDVNNGKIETEENIDFKSLEVDYITKKISYNYNGYYDENGQFIHLDLNPRVGHFYTDKKVGSEDGVAHHIPSYKLTSKMINIYLKPEYVIDGKNEVINRIGETLFHTINHDLHTHPYHPMINEDVENNYYSPLDVKLIARIFIVPVTNPEKIQIIDTRTRGGGIKDGLISEVKAIHQDAKLYWDIGNWNGEFYASNGVVVIELPENVLNDFTHNEIIAKVEKQLALGVLPVIEYV